MCGVAGVALRDPRRPVDPALLRRMTTIVRHRGPDGEGYHAAPGIGLGVRRLAIIDLRTGDQPIAGEDGSVTVVCNGEIYNYRELRAELEAAGHRFRTASDVEVIVHLYEDHGAECLARLRGMFGLALWDARRGELLLARDRLGIKPMHYALADDGLYFGSEMKSILMAGRVARDVDDAAIRDLFAYSFVPGPSTLFRHIRRLLPGHLLLYREGHASIRPYWDVTFPDAGEDGAARSEDQWAEELGDRLERAVGLHLRSDVPLGAWLSAGLDSSAIAALMRHLSGAPPPTFSAGFDEPAFDEVGRTRTLDRFPGHEMPNQRTVCSAQDIALFPKVVWHCEDPTTGGNEFPRMRLSALASATVKAVLVGEGADEIFGGYSWYALDRLLRPFAALPVGLRRLVAGPLAHRFPRGSRVFLAPHEIAGERFRRLVGTRNASAAGSLFSGDLRERLARMGEPGEPVAVARIRRWHPFHQLQYWELKTRLPDFIMLKLDRTSMAYSLEVRVPFVDHELVEFCARIPPSLQVRRRGEKALLRRAMRRHLPAEIVERPKRPLMTPRDEWLRSPLPAFAVEALSPERLRDAGHFDPDAIAGVLAAHRSGRGQYGDLLFGVLWIQLWEELLRRGCPSTGGEAGAPE